ALDELNLPRHAQTLRELHTKIECQNQMSPAVTSSPEFRPSLPEKFSGNQKECKGYLFQCRLIFENSPGSFPTDKKMITFILSQLTGRALEWSEARFASEDKCGATWDDSETVADIELWAEDTIQVMLDTTKHNQKVFLQENRSTVEHHYSAWLTDPSSV
uniref:DUF4939 domain-containing protein n=1 Tax=Cyprinodon variegatus TaxID=28743 RepID=A0A3Q2EC60_CYPVA